MPNDGKRAIVRCRDDDYLASFPLLDLDDCRGLHLDGHQPDAALYYAERCRAIGMLTSLDGGGLRSNTHELLSYIHRRRRRGGKALRADAPDALRDA